MPQPPPLKPAEIAMERVQMFPEKHVFTKKYLTENDTREKVLKGSAFPELLAQIQKVGLPPSLATIFVDMVYRSGDGWEWGAKASMVARNLGKHRSNISKYMGILVKIGIVERVDPRDKSSFWRFPKYDVLIQRIRDWKATNPPPSG